MMVSNLDFWNLTFWNLKINPYLWHTKSIRMKLRYSICIFILLFLSSFGLYSQALDGARAMFDEGRFAEALPIFQAAYANDMSENAALNQMLGVTLFKTGRILDAQRHLRFAAQRRTTDAHLYLGAIYAIMYHFADAEREFALFERANRRNAAALERLTEQRAYAERFRRAVSRTEDIQIIDSLIVPRAGFLEAFNLSASSGRLMPMNEFFDNVPGGDRILHINGLGDRVHFSSGDAAEGFSLFSKERLIDSFGNERRLPEPVNSAGSQAFPFVMIDGLTLYFASTGHNSLGGYDLFVTRHNLMTNNYLIPTQLNPPFNSPFNDFMLVIDEEKGIGWFASDRFQAPDSVIVYTFIPNPHVQLIESDDIEYLARRAMITSIADSWRENVDYTALRQRARQRVVVQQEVQDDFEFVINDNTVYRTLSDFRNTQARSLFSQAIMFESQLNTLNNQLKEQRNQFPTNPALRHSILDLERQTRELFEEMKRLKVEARNMEIMHN